jgi:AcrR family transcriptional regulator
MLDAAEAVVVEKGAAKLTLDAVAEAAGASKGGVLYHFPSKDALLGAMMDRLIERSAALREEALAAMPAGPGRELKAEIRANLTNARDKKQLCAALLAAIAIEPKLMGAAKDFHRRRFGAHGLGKEEFAQAAILLLAVDGLFLLEMLQVSPFSAAQRKKLLDAMLRQAETAGVQGKKPAAKRPRGVKE